MDDRDRQHQTPSGVCSRLRVIVGRSIMGKASLSCAFQDDESVRESEQIVANVRLDPGEGTRGKRLVGIGGAHKAAAIAGEEVFRNPRLVGGPDAVDSNQSATRFKGVVSDTKQADRFGVIEMV